MSWTIYRKDEKSAGVLALDDGLRLKYAENPESPEREMLDILGERLSGLSVIVTPPCSNATLEAIAANAPNLKKIFVADENSDRLRLWEVSLKPSGISCEALLLEGGASLMEKQLYNKFSDFLVDMAQGRGAVYVPARFRRLESAFSIALERAVLTVQGRFCSSAAHQTTRRWHVIMNNIINTLFLKRETYSLSKAFVAESVTIVGAGPSLNDNIDILSKYQDKTFIIACDAALNALIEHNIIPDIAASSEDLLTSWRFFKKHPDVFNDILLAVPLSGNNVITRDYPGKIMFTSENESPLFFREFKEAVLSVDRGQCVGHYAFNMAMKLKPREIIMMGFDLALKNGEYHCKSMSAPYYNDNPGNFSLIDVKGNDGNILKTEAALLTYLRTFEGLIRDSGTRVINATGGGAFIEGTLIMPLEEALKNQSAKTVLPITENKKFAVISSADILENLKKCLSDAEKIIDDAAAAAGKMTALNFSNPFSRIPFDDPVFELVSGCSSFLLMAELIEALNSLDNIGFEKFMMTVDGNLKEFRGSVEFLTELIHSVNRKGGENYLVLKAAGVEPLDIPGFPSGPGIINIDAGARLFEIWRAARENNVGTLIALNGEVIPDAWVVPGLKCIDVKTLTGPLDSERYLWMPGYSVAGADENITEEWRKILPPDVDCNKIGEIFS
ncbi:MAG: hypothetical protein A2020_00820 [Lentisphaerae bacterium GWF2_45_14]|nr:MAG: hypothetical protein A2020_00820 [Lentisphaerae bacterium GWF2_45_14]